MVEVFTDKKHRFGKTLVIGKVSVQVDEKGHAMVPKDLISQALINGFELVDKSIKYETEEEKKHVEEVNDILNSAKAQAGEIIAQAKKQAEEIIAQAKAEAGKITAEEQVDEKAEKEKELNTKKVEELKALCLDAGIPEESWKNLKKADLVNLLMKFIFE